MSITYASSSLAFLSSIPCNTSFKLHTTTSKQFSKQQHFVTYRRRRPPTSPIYFCQQHQQSNSQTKNEFDNTLQSALSRISQFQQNSTDPRTFTINLLDEISQAASLLPSSDPNSQIESSVTPVYNLMRQAGFLKAFATARASTTNNRNRNVSVANLVSQVGLPLSALSPRKSTVFIWQFAGALAVISVVQILSVAGLQMYARPTLVALGAMLVADQLLLRGLVFESIYRALLPKYTEKIITHEAGHFLAAYLCGLPIRGYILSAREAFQVGIPGQAGTLFTDDVLAMEINRAKVTSSSIDRFSIVAMAGIAAEALTYGEAEGGEADITDLLRLLTTLQPPWNEQSVRSQARWAVLQAVLLLRGNENAFNALKNAMRERKSLGECVICIEDNFVPIESNNTQMISLTEQQGNKDIKSDDKEAQLSMKEKEIIEQLENIRKKVDELPQQ